MSLEKYVESIEDELEEYGIGRIVPPAGWTPRKRGYDDVDFRVEKAITQHATGRKGLFRTLLVEKKPLSVKHDFKPMAERPENQPSKAALEDPTHATIEREFWKKVAYDPPTYCADVAGTLFDAPTEDSDDATITKRESDDCSKSCSITTPGWDVSRLDSLLSRTLREKNITLDGVNSSYLYFGMWRALFAWHTEDCDLYSVNYLHYGAPKFWYAVAPEDRERFEILAQGMVPEMWRACPEFLRHKELLISPTLLEQNGIPFTRMMQKPGEFVVTYPGSYHSGFNCGYNCAESCNFATEAWVEIGEDAGVCECVPDAVSLDMRIFGDLCTRCHSDTEEDESDDESDSDASESEAASERKLAARRKRGTDTTQKVTVKRKRARGVSGGVSPDSDDSDDDEDSKKRRARRRGSKPRGDDAKRFLATKTKAVLVPEGWTRSVVMRGARGAPSPAGPGRPKSAAGDRDTYYTSPDGVVVKSKYEVVKYLGSNPAASAEASLSPRDFYFESRPEDAPPARLFLASPATPSPTASADGARRENKKRADDEKQSGAKKRKASSKISGADRRGSGGRDALGVLRGGNNASTNLSASARGKTRGVKPNAVSSSGNQKALVKKKFLRTPTQRAVGTAVETETFSSLSKAGGALERAVADVMRRAQKSAGRYACGIRGSSLVMQVEQALGVGSGALRGHGSQIQSLARAKGRMPPRQRA